MAQMRSSNDSWRYYKENAFIESTNSWTIDGWNTHTIRNVDNNEGDQWTNGTQQAITDNKGTAGIDEVCIGEQYDSSGPQSDLWNGYLADVAIWNTPITNADAQILAAGYSALFVKPANLIHYFPMISDYRDVIGKASLTITGTPSNAALHPPIIYPTPAQLAHITAAAPPAAAAAAAKFLTLLGVGS
jgi:hypothetical protein